MPDQPGAVSPSDPAGTDLAALRARFRTMMIIVAACAVLGVGSIAAFFMAHSALGLWGFIAALLCGFAAQVWFVAAMRR